MEYAYCLRKNLENPAIQKVCLFIEDDYEAYVKSVNPILLTHAKLQPIRHQKRVTFLEMFAFANANFAHGTLIAIGNADIYFDASLDKLAGFNMTGAFIALSRAYDVTGELALVECDHNRWCDSQDAWIVSTPVSIANCDFGLGVRGCDNRLIFEARTAGYRVIDPVTVIKSYHVHASQYRTYDGAPPVPGPYQHCLDFELK
jgi:hypothetical protein